MDLVDVAGRDHWVLYPEVPKVPSVYSRSCRTGRNVRDRGGLCRGRLMFVRGVRIPGREPQPSPSRSSGAASRDTAVPLRLHIRPKGLRSVVTSP